MYDILKVGSVSFGGQTVFMSGGLHPINHLDWGAVREGGGGYKAGHDYSYDESGWLTQQMSHLTKVKLKESFEINAKDLYAKNKHGENKFTASLNHVAPCVFHWGLQQCKPPAHFIRSQVGALAYKVYTIHGGLATIWAEGTLESGKSGALVSPFCDTGLSVLGLVIGQVVLRPRLISRC